MAKQKKPPSKVFRIGQVSASVFENELETENGNRTVRSVNVQRRYRDGDETKYSSSFGIAELSQAIRALQLAQSHIEAAEAELV